MSNDYIDPDLVDPDPMDPNPDSADPTDPPDYPNPILGVMKTFWNMLDWKVVIRVFLVAMFIIFALGVVFNTMGMKLTATLVVVVILWALKNLVQNYWPASNEYKAAFSAVTLALVVVTVYQFVGPKTRPVIFHDFHWPWQTAESRRESLKKAIEEKAAKEAAKKADYEPSVTKNADGSVTVRLPGQASIPVDTGVEAQENVAVEFSGMGVVSYGSGDFRSEVAGNRNHPGEFSLCPGGFHGETIVLINDNIYRLPWRMTFNGWRADFVPKENGRIFVTTLDSDHSNNKGYYTITIK